MSLGGVCVPEKLKENEMDNNNKNNQNNNKNRKNVNGLLILVIWAVGLTVVFNYLSAYSRQANMRSSTASSSGW